MSLSPAKRHMRRIASIGCVVCTRLGVRNVPSQLHHTISGNDYSVVPLCPTHHDPHRTGSGFHGMGAKKFCSLFKVPELHELGLLAWVQEDTARLSA